MEEKIKEIVKRCVEQLNINGAVRKETIIHKAIEEALTEASKNLVQPDVIKSVCDHNQMTRKKEFVARCGKCGKAWFTE